MPSAPPGPTFWGAPKVLPVAGRAIFQSAPLADRYSEVPARSTSSPLGNAPWARPTTLSSVPATDILQTSSACGLVK
jgi:hypothetical protein